MTAIEKRIGLMLSLTMIVLVWTAHADEGSKRSKSRKNRPVSSPKAPKIKIGEPKIHLRPTEQLRYFPDEVVNVLGNDPLTALIVAGKSTWYCVGSNIESLKPVSEVLAPGGAGSFDNGYTGIGGVIQDNQDRLFAFYHAEDHEGMPKIDYNDVHGFYASVGMAVSNDGGRSFNKVGQVLTSNRQKDPGGPSAQGVGDVSVCESGDGKHVLAYFSDWTDMKERGTQISHARIAKSALDEGDSWEKWHDNKYGEKGIGGKSTPVLTWRKDGGDAHAPQVQYVPALHAYVMVYCVLVYKDFEKGKPTRSGIYISFSDDGIQWSRQELVYKAMTVPIPGKEIAIHPTFIISESKGKRVSGLVVCGFSPSWGHDDAHPPHHLAGVPVVLTIE